MILTCCKNCSKPAFCGFSSLSGAAGAAAAAAAAAATGSEVVDCLDTDADDGLLAVSPVLSLPLML